MILVEITVQYDPLRIALYSASLLRKITLSILSAYGIIHANDIFIKSDIVILFMAVEFCVHGNLSFSCHFCNPNPRVNKVIESGENEFTEAVRCKRCDSPTVSKPKRKTYGCPVCLFKSHKENWPFDSNAETRVPKPTHHGGGLRKVQVHSEMMKEIKKFRKNHWIKIPNERRSEILTGTGLSKEYSEIYKELLKFLKESDS